jgi:hypothetical protein
MPSPMPEVDPVTTAVLPLSVMANLFQRSRNVRPDPGRILPQRQRLEYAI